MGLVMVPAPPYPCGLVGPDLLGSLGSLVMSWVIRYAPCVLGCFWSHRCHCVAAILGLAMAHHALKILISAGRRTYERTSHHHQHHLAAEFLHKIPTLPPTKVGGKIVQLLA